MTDQKTAMPDWLKSFGPIGIPELSDRDAACMVLPDLDYDSQLAAIHQLLRNHQQADDALAKEIAEIEAFAQRTSGIRNERAVDEWTDRLHHSVYQDAAHSMSAVGMLAPMIESVFYQAFQSIRKQMSSDSTQPSAHDRWKRPAEDQWDCHYVWSKGRRSTNLVEGVMQLSEATGLDVHLPGDLRLTLQALFEYRNKMFHNGFEWPVEERERFAKRIVDACWPSDWFKPATRGDKPWVNYMTDDFIRHCVAMIEEVIRGIGAFCKARLYPAGSNGEANA